MDQKIKELYEQTRTQWGLGSQILMAIEELNELAVCLAHSLRANKPFDLDHIKEEISDVEIMLDQTKYYLNISETDLKPIKDFKLARVRDLLRFDIEHRGT